MKLNGNDPVIGNVNEREISPVLDKRSAHSINNLSNFGTINRHKTLQISRNDRRRIRLLNLVRREVAYNHRKTEIPTLKKRTKRKKPALSDRLEKRASRAGGALFSHRPAPAVPSARAGLTSGFGTGPGVPPQPGPPARETRSRGRGAPLRAAQRVAATILSCAPPLRRGGGARPISGARLRASPPLHLRPINQVVSLGPYRREGQSRGRLPA